MTHRPSSDFIQSLDITGLIPLDEDYFAPNISRQFAVEAPNGGILHADNDQQWVKDGRALVPSTCRCPDDHRDVPDGSHVVERDITITYGPWRPLDSEPAPVVDPAVAALHALSDHLLALRDRLDPNRSPKQDGRRGGLEESATWARNAADKIERGEPHV